MLTPETKRDPSFDVVESPMGLEIRLRELKSQPVACIQWLIGAVLLVAAATVVTWTMENDWPHTWTRTGVAIACGCALAVAVLVPVLRLFYRWRHVLIIHDQHLAHHYHAFWGEHHQRVLPLARIRRISAKPELLFVDPYGESYGPLRDYRGEEQQRVYRLIVDHLRAAKLLPTLHEIDAWEARVESLEKPAESTLRTQEREHAFRVEIPLPALLPNERNRLSVRKGAMVAVCALGLAGVSLLAALLTGLPFFILPVAPAFFAACLAAVSSVSSLLGRERATALTRELTQAISVVGDLLVRTTALGDKQIWRRGEIRDIQVAVTLGSSDSEGNSTPDTVALSVLTWQGHRAVLHQATFERGRHETPREEIEWIASQLRLAFELYRPATAESVAPTAAPSPGSTAIVANQHDVQR